MIIDHHDLRGLRRGKDPQCAVRGDTALRYVRIHIFLTGCGSKGPLDPGDPVSLTIWHYYNGSQQAAFDVLVEEFNETVLRSSRDAPVAAAKGSQSVLLIIMISVDFAVGKIRSVPSAAIQPSAM